MSTLSMVRHGQASFLSDNYDQLSPLGEEQARLLGRYWAQRGVRFDEVITGPRLRQIETARLAGESMREAGVPWPEPQMVEEFDEHHADRLARVAIAEVVSKFPHIEPLAAAYHNAKEAREKFRSFQFMFQEVVDVWLAGSIEIPEVESWRQFCARVDRGLARITESEKRGHSVAVFTSVGPIIIALQKAIGCTDRKAIDIGWRVRNCTQTDLVYSPGRLMIDSFNAFPHLENQSLWTYR